MTLRSRRFGLALATPLLVAALASACKDKKAEDKSAGSSADKSAGRSPGAASGGTALVAANAKGPDGVAFKKVDLPFGSVEVPDGQDWTLQQGDSTQVEGADGTVIMLQAQDGITPDQRDEYLASYHDVQTRDAPKYERVKQETGEILGAPGARVEGKFDNGTAFVTRDYLIFSKGKVVMVGGRTPAANAARLAPLMDHLAATLSIK